MKIAHVVSLSESVPPRSKNGLEFLVSWLVEELVTRGHEITLFAPESSKTRARLVPLLSGRVRSGDSGLWNNTFFSIQNTILAAYLADRFDIIHLHNGNGSLITPFVRVPVVETIHNPVDLNPFKMYLVNSKEKKLIAPVLENLSKVNYVAVSRNQEKSFLPYESYYFKKHSVIHNGILIEKFSFNKNPKDYLLYLGYINANKGADVALRVARKLRMKLILAGHTTGEEKFFEEKIRPYLSKDIRYVGPVGFAEKNRLYKNALVTLAPISWDEPFGLTFIESQACGTPVIAFNRGASAEIIKDGKTGFVVGNESEMIRAVKNIHAITRQDCRDWVSKYFSVERMTDEYEKLYARLLKTK